MNYKNIYSIGYALKDAQETLQSLVEDGAIILDIRLQPRSRWAKQFNKDAMIATYGDYEKSALGHYCHIADLGNTAYLDKLGYISLKNEKAGIPLVLSFLEAYDVVLLCACKNWNTCHRHKVAELLIEQEHTLKALHFNKDDKENYNVLSVWDEDDTGVVSTMTQLERVGRP